MILALCRFSEPLTQTLLMSYLYFLLESFHEPGSPPPSSASISRRAGIMTSSSALAQCVTGMIWGRPSDYIGHKPCILLRLTGTTLSILGFGIAENFSIWPSMFGHSEWALRWRWVLPNIVSAIYLSASWLAGLLFLSFLPPEGARIEPLLTLSDSREPQEPPRHRIRAAFGIDAPLFRQKQTPRAEDETASLLIKEPPRAVASPPPIRDIMTPNIMATLVAFARIPLQNSTFMNLYNIFLSTPRSAPLPADCRCRHNRWGWRCHYPGLAGSYAS